VPSPAEESIHGEESGFPEAAEPARATRRNKAAWWVLLVLLCLGAVPLVWLAMRGPYREACRQLDRATRARGGITDAEQIAPDPLRGLLGGDHLRNVVGVTLPRQADDEFVRQYVTPVSTLRSVWLGGPGITDRAVGDLRKLRGLEHLILRKTRLTDEGTKQLAGFRKLRTLDLSSTRVTDRGLRTLAGLACLEVVVLNDTLTSDAGLEVLSGLKQLKTLNLANTRVSDAGIERLVSLCFVEDLTLEGTAITDKGLARLSGLTSLKVLRLGGTGVTDQGLAELRSLRQLEVLDLRQTAIGDAGLAALDPLPSLKYLWLERTSVTDKALEEFAANHEGIWSDRHRSQASPAAGPTGR
jgi:hypothetical protein